MIFSYAVYLYPFHTVMSGSCQYPPRWGSREARRVCAAVARRAIPTITPLNVDRSTWNGATNPGGLDVCLAASFHAYLYASRAVARICSADSLLTDCMRIRRDTRILTWPGCSSLPKLCFLFLLSDSSFSFGPDTNISSSSAAV